MPYTSSKAFTRNARNKYDIEHRQNRQQILQ